jgi:hypothetical protein
MLLEPPLGGVLIVSGDKMPETPSDELGEESAGVGRPDKTRVFSRADKRQPLTLVSPDKPLLVSFLKECKEPCGVPEVIWHDVVECRCVCLFICLINTSGAAGGGFLVFMLLKGFFIS